MNVLHMTKDDLTKVQTFVNKYPEVETFELQYDGSSGIGLVLHVAVNVASGGDFVQIRKTIVDESNW